MSTDAVVIEASASTPVVKSIPLQEPAPGQTRVKVVAVGYSHLVRMRASGKHYSSAAGSQDTKVGVDGVGFVGDDAVYFAAFGPGQGSYAQYVNVDSKSIFPLPKGITDEESLFRVAALANGTMLSILAFAGRVKDLPENATVAIMGVTGTSGSLAIQVAKKIYGVKKVIGVARSKARLESLQESQPLLDEIVSLESSDAELAETGLSGVDVVLDYLWGSPSRRVMNIVSKRPDSLKLVQWIEIGSILGEAEMSLPAALFRSNNFVLMGSGIGPMDPRLMGQAMQVVVNALATGQVSGPTSKVHISDIAQEWSKPWDSTKRTFFHF